MTKKNYEFIANLIIHTITARDVEHFTDIEAYRMIGIMSYDLEAYPNFNKDKFERYLSQKLAVYGYDLDQMRVNFRNK